MLSNRKVLVQRLGYIHTYRRCRYRIKWRIVESGKTKLDAYIYHKSAVSINILDQRYLQLKVYLCLAEIIDCLVILMSSWQISSLLQNVASGNQSTLSNVFKTYFLKQKPSDPPSRNKISNQPTTHIRKRSSFCGRCRVLLWVCVCRWTAWEGETKWLLQKIALVDFWNSIFRSQWSWFVQDVDFVSAEIESLDSTTWAPARSPCSPACHHPELYDA